MVNEICNYYKGCKSIKATARKFNLSDQKVRKILITNGLYTSPQISVAQSLYNLGLSYDEIAERMNVTKHCVIAYLPYVKCVYNDDHPTPNALRVRKCKAKNREKYFKKK